MYNGKKILALIPARSGSEGLPGKNIKPLAGKPLIAWTIEQARGSRYIDRIITSTDSKKIAEIAKKYGSETPFLRPPSLATADSKGMDVILHALEWLRINDKPSDMIIYLQPTSPLRASEDIDNAIRLLFLK
jgi:CMP-N-acetylneuraminic acid synthetase